MSQREREPRLAAGYSREQALRFPLGVDSHDTGLRYLFDFTVAARALDLRPGARVLDFASGSGFVSELLNRLGYRSVAVDLDPGTLRNARERLGIDPRCEPGRGAFVAGNGHALPFADGVFDGVLCMNALHHMPDYRLALSEMQRVLRPGGRASFSEPGSLHSQSPESIQVMRQFGVVEKDVVLEEGHAQALAVGFERMLLKPYLYPELVDLDYRDFDGLRRGAPPPGSRLDGATVADVVEKSPPAFCLVKGGGPAPDSTNAPPEWRRASLRVAPLPEVASAQTRIPVAAECTNTGRSIWIARPRDVGGHVTFGAKILRADGRLIDDLQGRSVLPADVAPGQSVRIETELSLASLPPGSYRLAFDMVLERVAWFQDLGSPGVEREIRVE